MHDMSPEAREARRQERLRTWTVRKFDSFDAARKAQLLDWQKAGAGARLDAAWELVEDFAAMKGIKKDELELQRSTVRVRRS